MLLALQRAKKKKTTNKNDDFYQWPAWLDFDRFDVLTAMQEIHRHGRSQHDPTRVLLLAYAYHFFVTILGSHKRVKHLTGDCGMTP